ncbi:MAG: pyridoxamine 5'-phosphate oxidase family protein [Phycisphaerae bacterium]
MDPIQSTPQSSIRQLPKRGSYDRDTIYAILDEALLAHVGFEQQGQPYVIPMAYARMGDRLVLHGAANSRIMTTMATGQPLCVTVTLLDDLVLAKSALHHSMNYRSVVILGRARPVTDAQEKRSALRAIVEHIVPGRWEQCRQPTPGEEQATGVATLAIDQASAKLRTGPPIDAPEDQDLAFWAGLLPISTTLGPPQAADYSPADAPVPDHVASYRRPAGLP